MEALRDGIITLIVVKICDLEDVVSFLLPSFVNRELLKNTMIMMTFSYSGDMETNSKVCQMILQKIMEDPQSGSCLNLSYADVTGPVANFNPTGSPYATKSGIYVSTFGKPLTVFIDLKSSKNG